MACKIGMTTNPGERKRYWQGKYPNLQNWMILARYDTKSVAQLAEYHLAAKYGGVVDGGGAGNENGEWVVYKFDY
ncbi:MAG: GIY-YIG nuclease family protein [Gammaproteobacteria bacterium]